MRILHTSDWHLGRSLEGRSRHQEQVEVMAEICDIADAEKIDLVLIAGDIFDSANPPSEAEHLFYETMSRLSQSGPRAVVVICGNHDSPYRLCAASSLAHQYGIVLAGLPGSVHPCLGPTKNIEVINSGENWLELKIGTIDHTAVVVTLPYPSEARLGKALKNSLNENILQAEYSEKVGFLLSEAAKNFRTDTVNLIVSHLFVMGGGETDSERPIQVGGAYTVSPNVFPANAHYAALGHLHRSQSLKGACKIKYSGSPLAYSFSETEQIKAVTLIEVIPLSNVCNVTEIPLLSGKQLVNWHFQGERSEIFEFLKEQKDRKVWVDLTLTLDSQLTFQDIQKIRDIHDGIIHIKTKYKDMQTEEIEVEKRAVDPYIAFAEFYRKEKGTEPNPELLKVFQEMLAQEDKSTESSLL